MLSIQLLQLCQNAILEDSGLIHHELTNNIDSVEPHIRPFLHFLMTESPEFMNTSLGYNP